MPGQIPPMLISLFQDLYSDPGQVEISWLDLCKELSSVDRVGPGPCAGHSTCEAKKKGPLWSPAFFHEGKARSNENALGVSALVVDLDAPTDAQMATLAARLQALGLSYFCHATHCPGFYRLVVPFAKAIPPHAFQDVRAGALALLGAPGDPATKDLARFYYLPGLHDDATHFETFEQDGRALMPEECLAARPNPIPVSEKLSEILPEKFSEKFPIDLASIKEDLRRVRKRESVIVARRLIAGEPLAATGERDATINRAASVLATAPREPITQAAAMAVMEPCIRAMGEHLAPEGLDAWLEKARGSFDRALERRIENDRTQDETRRRMLKLLGRDEASNRAVEAGDDEDDDSWRRGLLYALDAQGQPASLKPSGANVNLILANDPDWRGALVFNEITKEIDILSGPMKNTPKASLDVEIANWLARSEYKLSMRSHEVGEQLLAVARKNPIDPLRDYLMSLKWDGKIRARQFFQKYFGARGDLIHNETISKKWLVSCVARALDPGCKVDTVLILQGPQGRGKSRSLRILGGEWFCDTPIDLRNKDSRLMSSRFWIVELSELTSIKRHDVETLKNFFGASEDYIRPPYGRVAEVFKRRAVYVGTTNSDEYLVDSTGNRRYWPVEIAEEEIDIDALRADRDQIWAEAVATYLAGVSCEECRRSGSRCQAHSWWLNEEQAELAEQVASNVVKTSHFEEPILKWLLSLRPLQRPTKVSIGDVASKALGMATERMQHGLYVEIGFALKRLGFRKQRVRQAGMLVWVHNTPENLLKAQVLEKGEIALAVVNDDLKLKP